LVGAVERHYYGTDERGLAGTDRAGERNDVARAQAARELCGELAEIFCGGKGQAH
jgi:hypothetical protein